MCPARAVKHNTKQEFSSHAKLDKLMYMNVSHYVVQKDNENKKYITY